MFFAKALAVLSTLALSALAAPHGGNIANGAAVGGLAGGAGSGLVNSHHQRHNVVGGALNGAPAGGAGSGLVHDKRALLGVAVIFTNMAEQMAAPIMELQYLQVANATQANVKTIVANIQTPVNTAVIALKALVGVELDIILAPVEGDVQLTIQGLAGIIAPIICIIFDAVACLISKLNIGVFVVIFAPLGSLLTTLLTVLFSLCAIEDVLAALLTEIAPVAKTLQFVSLISLLQL